MPRIYDADDIVDLKNRKKKKKRRLKFLVFLLVVGTASGLYLTRDKWYNKLRGIGEQYKTIVNSGKTAEGNFPIEVSSGEDYQLKLAGNIIAVLSDTYTYYYDTEGALLKRRQHTYNNSVLRTSDGYVLIYENGGNDLSVETSDYVLYSKHFDDQNILFARISSEGYAAAITTSENYSCEIHVYDKKGKIVYERKCIEMVSDLSFLKESKSCIISYISAENGELVTNVRKLSFTETGEIWTSPGLNTLGLEVFGFDNGAFVLGSDACGYIDNNGQIASYFQYDGELKGGASSNGKSAVIINNDDRRKYMIALLEDVNSEPLIISLEEPSIDVTVYNNLAYVLCQGKIMAYDFNGGLRSTAEVSDSYTGFARSKEHIFLKGYNKIDRIDYES